MVFISVPLIVLLYMKLTYSDASTLQDFLLSQIPDCKGVIRDITKDPLGDCVLDALYVEGHISDNSTAPSLIHYTWRGDESVETRCQCIYDLLVIQNRGNTSFDNFCEDNSPVICSSMCISKRRAQANKTCLAQHYQLPPCSSDHYCIMYTGLSVGNKSSYVYYILADGLTCNVLQNYANDICQVLVGPVNNYLEIGLGVGIAGGVGLSTGIAVVLAVVLCLCWRVKLKRSKPILNSTEISPSIKNTPTMTTIDVELKPTFNQQLFAKVLVDNSNIKITGYLGEGAFAIVQEGLLTLEESGYLIQKHVAIKRLKDTSTNDEVEEFISESAIMLDFDHPNVLSLLGVCFDTEDHLPLIILPFMANGDLKSFLIEHRSDEDVNVLPCGMTQYNLISMCTDIAQGMEYLSRLKFVHRDLAARNCMVDEQLNVKVADFGLSRDVYATQYYRLERKTRLPVKWMPPESLLDNIYNEKTDVWSFGVTCWEVFSLGRSPYPGVDNADVIEYICNERRLHKPALCSEKMYSLMHNCWIHKGSERPSFQVISESLQEMKSSIAPDCGSKAITDSSERAYFVLEQT